ncbi:MAG: haloacid dehalogenase type II [Verrucomicrobia bacterium]|nr:haloacid dehalogenase type II [Verrucomicrobiota bacterium]
MPLRRRQFLQLTAGRFAAGVVSVSALARAAGNRSIKAIAFDAFTIFDPRPVFALAATLFPAQGTALGNAWRTRQFEYTWLRTLYGRYTDFWQVTEQALIFAAKLVKVDLSTEHRQALMGAYLEIQAYPDAAPALRSLREADLRLAFLSNMTRAMLDAVIKNAGFEELFEHRLSTDAVQAYKPDSRAYQMGTDAFGLAREEILFAAFGGWDAAGAKGFGYPTFWVNRLNLPVEELGIVLDGTGGSLTDLVTFVKR